MSASLHSEIWPVIVTVTNRALLSSSFSVPRSTADENSNHNHWIIEENSYTVQLTVNDGNCSSSIYLLAFHLRFVSKTLSFHLQITCIHVCWSYCFYDIWSLKVRKTTELQLLTGYPFAPQPPISASLCPNRPFLLHRPPRVSHRPQGGGSAHFGNHWSNVTTMEPYDCKTLTSHWSCH